MSEDTEYRDRLQSAIFEAIVRTSIDKQTNVAMIKSGEVYGALMMNLACILSTSEETSSPTKARKVSEHFAKQLQRKIAAFREQGRTPFDDVIHMPGGTH